MLCREDGCTMIHEVMVDSQRESLNTIDIKEVLVQNVHAKASTLFITHLIMFSVKESTIHL